MKNRRMQLDLFVAVPSTRMVDPDQRNKPLPLIEELLKEAAAADALVARQENGDDQNHP